ncbi:MAG: HAMP domain-containing histidine kinase [Acidothermus sp.]|nr:HAMP domain-containing histidine kinase [Acidothermus sp.]MCL6538413.1 HAMP domain-containing protein [Acidothermus sp.]
MNGQRDRGLAARLFIAHLLVVIVAAITLWLVATAVGPPIFHGHLRYVVGRVDPLTSRHVEDAFRSASAISLAVSTVVSLLAAFGISYYVSRRIATPVRRLAVGARALASGKYDVRIDSSGLGAEFSALADSFNAMAARLESVEATRRRLLSDLAHEMRTPVSTIDAYLEGLADGVIPSDIETLSMLRAQTARLARLADDLTAVSRAEEHQLELRLVPANPAELIATAVAAVRERAVRAGIELTTEIAPGLPRVRVDTERFAQVLGNLLDNALRHTPGGGMISVRAEPAGRGVRFVVADTGEGIAPEHLPHVFERFYRIDRARDRAHGGSGIGLAIVKALVEAQGGMVTAESGGPGHGATFAVTLPAAPVA